MCRSMGEQGGRRCAGCTSPRARTRHNERRRENRAIKRNAADWARQQGDEAAVHMIETAPAKDVKEWLRGRGQNPDDFVGGVPGPPQHAPEPGAANGISRSTRRLGSNSSSAAAPPTKREAYAFLGALKAGDRVLYVADGKEQIVTVQEALTRPDGVGSWDGDTRVKIGYGPGRWNREVSAGTLASGSVTLRSPAESSLVTEFTSWDNTNDPLLSRRRALVADAAKEGRAVLIPAGARDNPTALIAIDGVAVGQASVLGHRVREVPTESRFAERQLVVQES